MDKTSLTLSALLTLVTGGLIYVIQDGKQQQVEIAEAAAAAGTVEITASQAKTPVLRQATDSGATGDLKCERGVIANAKTRIYCTDGKTAGFLLDPAAESAIGESATVQVIGGRLYTKQEIKVEALGSK